MSNQYAGTSVFFKNRAGNHNWLENRARPMMNIVTTLPTGQRLYKDVFVNSNEVEVKVTKSGKVTITFDAQTTKPIFRILDQKSGRVDA
jgi:hypothetical protein